MGASEQRHWLVKQEPAAYSWSDFCKERGTAWTGVRNFQARKNLSGMKRGDRVLFYHSGDEKRVVGVAKVTREAYPDPTATEGQWVAVDLAPVKPLEEPVPLASIKGQVNLADMALVRQSRLSVMPVTELEFETVLQMGRSAINEGG